MTKTYMKDEMREQILLVLNGFGISKEIIDHANKMNLDIPMLFLEKIIKNNNDQNEDIVVKNLLGVYGNHFATCYFEGRGYRVLNEAPVFDENGINITTYADLEFTNEAGKKNLCEVKAATQIIDSTKNYVDPDSFHKDNYDKDDEIRKFKAIGKKLITQVTKLSKSGANVNVIIFEGCYVDDQIRERLHNLDVTIITLYSNIYDLEKDIKEKVMAISLYFKNIKDFDNCGKIKK